MPKLETGLAQIFGTLGMKAPTDELFTSSYLTPVFWVPFLVNETVTVAFVINKAWKSRRIPRVHHFNEATLLDTLIQHSILYYLS